MSESEYRLEISEPAEIEIDAIFLWIQERSFAGAKSWYDGLMADFEKLCFMPYKYPMFDDDAAVRRTHYHGFRIVYRIIEATELDEKPVVRVLHVRHGSQISEAF